MKLNTFNRPTKTSVDIYIYIHTYREKEVLKRLTCAGTERAATQRSRSGQRRLDEALRGFSSGEVVDFGVGIRQNEEQKRQQGFLYYSRTKINLSATFCFFFFFLWFIQRKRFNFRPPGVGNINSVIRERGPMYTKHALIL